MNEPKILILDIETTHNVVAAFDLQTEYIPHDNILKERIVVCACWKFLGEKKIYSVATYNGDDRVVIKTLIKLIDDADAVVAHNGDSFDLKMIKGRALIHGFPPLAPVTTIDTLKISRGAFRLNSNRLDYLGKVLGFGGKTKTDNGLWLEVLKGNKSAINKMVTYNKRDVDLLEKVFLKLRPYAPNYINRELFGKAGCPRCGSNHTQSRGIHRAISRVYRRFQCQNIKCMGWFRAAVNEKKPTTRSRVL